MFAGLLGSNPFGGLKVIEVDAQRQARTARDVKVAWVRPKVPSKRNGRKGTRKGWKRKHPPHWTFAYREPEDVIVFQGRTIIVTPRQMAAIERATTLKDSPR
jgi:hypothetical protein